MNNHPPLHKKGSSGPHLTQEQLFHMLEGQLTPVEQRNLEAHLQNCELCTEAMEGLASTNSSASQAALLELNHLIKKRTSRRKHNTLLTDIKTWGVATAIIFIVLICAAIVWNVVNTTKPAENNTASSAKANLTPHAQPIKGYQHLQEYLRQEQQKLPVKTRFTKGKVVVTFIVNPDSTLSNFKVTQSLSPVLDQAAIEMVQKGPAWQPATIQNKIISQRITLPVVFK